MKYNSSQLDFGCDDSEYSVDRFIVSSRQNDQIHI